jgi:EAL domain-containing protein (putative c-di-GMP-specific phosphodiesterase class I)
MTKQNSQADALQLFLGEATSAADGPHKSIERILGVIRCHLGMEVSFVAEFADGQRVFRHVSAQAGCAVVPGGSDPLEATYCQRLVDGRLPELIADTAAVPEAAGLAVTEALQIGAYLGVPLRLSGGRIYGTLCSFSHEPDLSLNERDLNMLRAFAEIAAAQIEAQLDAERARQERIEGIMEVIARDSVMMVYQPIYGIDEGRAVGVECLARFPDCEKRPPSDWFAEAAEVGLGVELELFAVRRALAALPYLPAEVYLAVNLSPAAILSGEVEDVLAGVPDGRLVIEITEHEAILDYVELARALEPLRKRARIAIDDVGAGYSGLRHILDLRPDIIKLDMSLTRDIDRDAARFALATALAEFARGIGSEVVAEGVETAAEMQALRQLGIDKAQGYYLSRPLPLLAAHQLLSAARPSHGTAPAISADEPFRNRRRFRS